MRNLEIQEMNQTDFVHVRALNLHTLTAAVLRIFDEPLVRAVHRPPAVRAERLAEAADAADLEGCVSQMLLQLGIPPHVHGYKFLRLAILTALEDASVLDSLTHGLYPIIAQTFDTTPARAERSMRHAIELAWNRGNGTSFEQLFPRCSFYTDNCPTIREFLALTVEKARLSLKDR